jgi:hypothetical protein
LCFMDKLNQLGMNAFQDVLIFTQLKFFNLFNIFLLLVFPIVHLFHQLFSMDKLNKLGMNSFLGVLIFNQLKFLNLFNIFLFLFSNCLSLSYYLN